MQGGLLAIEPIQVGQETLHAAVRAVLEQVPVQAAIMIPLGPLGELTAHEDQLLAWVGVQIRIQQPQVGKLLPVITGHLFQQRRLAMHYLVMRERQQEVLPKRIDHAECEAVVVVLAVDRIQLHIGESVVHPAHVPLEAKP